MRGAYRATDQFVGARIRERRVALGLSQQDLAESVGLASQQIIVKYELGINAVSASLLYEIAGAMDTPVDSFFDGFDTNEEIRHPRRLTMLLNFMRNFSAIESEPHREAISQLIRVLTGDLTGTGAAVSSGAREAPGSFPSRRRREGGSGSSSRHD
jgi:transcriptional regulator with XRE-family HTH domain